MSGSALVINSPADLPRAGNANATDIVLADQLNPDGVTYTSRGLPVGALATAVLDQLVFAPGTGTINPATASALGVVKVGPGLSVANDGTVSANIGTSSTQVAGGDTVAAINATASTALSNATSALTAANAAGTAASAASAAAGAAGTAAATAQTNATSALSTANAAGTAAGSASTAAATALVTANTAITTAGTASTAATAAQTAAATALSTANAASATAGSAVSTANAAGITAAAASTLAGGALQKSDNLASLGNVAAARSNLGLAALAVLGVGVGLAAVSGSLAVAYGTAANTAAAGNDSRIVNAIQASAIGANNGVAGLDSLGNASALNVVPAGGSTPITLAAVAAQAAAGGLTPAAANLVLAGPVSGGSATPTARALVSTDLPAITAAGTTAARSLVTRFGDFNNVLDYGVLLTGVDDSAAFQAMYNSLPNNSVIDLPDGVVHVPSFTTSTAKTMFYRGNAMTTAAGAGGQPLYYFGDGDVLQTYYSGSLHYSKQIINTGSTGTTSFGAVNLHMLNASPAGSTNGNNGQYLQVNTISDQPGATGWMWNTRNIVNVGSSNGNNNQLFGRAVVVSKSGGSLSFSDYMAVSDNTGMQSGGGVGGSGFIVTENDIWANGPDSGSLYVSYQGSRVNQHFTVISQYPGAGGSVTPGNSVRVWATGVNVAKGDLYFPTASTATTNLNVYVAQNAGTTGSTEPNWAGNTTYGNTFTDSAGITWAVGVKQQATISRMFAFDTLNAASINNIFSGQATVNGAFVDAAHMTFNGTTGAVVRMAPGQVIDFSATSDATLNARVLGYASGALQYLISGTSVFSVSDAGNLTATVLPTAGSATALTLADFHGNIALMSGGNNLFRAIASNQTTISTQTVNISAIEQAGTDTQGVETNTVWGLGAFVATHSNFNTVMGFGAGNNGGSNNNTLVGFAAGNLIGNGGQAGQHTMVGSRAGINTTTGGFCTFVGSNAGSTNSIGLNHVVVGHGAMGGNDFAGVNLMVGSSCTALGNWALQGITGGQDIIGIGVYCGRLFNNYLTTTNATKTILIGDNIGYNGLGGGSYSVIIGANALYNSGGPYTTTSSFKQTVNNLSTVGYSVIIGASSASTLTNGAQVLIGYQVGQNMVNPTAQTVVGYQGAINVINGGNSVYMGSGVAGNIVNGGTNVYIGANAGTNGVVFNGYISDGTGTAAGTVLTVPSGGITQGPLAVGQVITANGATTCTITAQTSGTTGQAGTYTVSVSQLSGTVAAPLVFANNDWSNTIAIGNGAGPTKSNQVWIGNSTTSSFYLGGLAGLAFINTANSNAYGNGAAQSITSGAFINAFGYHAAQATTTGSFITAMGHGALAANTTASDSTGFGYLAFNAATGTGVLRNTGLGSQVGVNITGGGYNTLVGAYCGTALILGNYNTFIGDGVNTTSGGGVDCSNSILIGRNVQAVSASNPAIIIGGNAHTVNIGGGFSMAAGAAGAATFGGTVAASGGFLGQTAGVAAPAGVIGELISANVAGGSAIALTTATPANITSITLTAGDWDVWGTLTISPSAAMTSIAGAVSQTSATLPSSTSTGAGSKFSLSAAWTSSSNQSFGVGSTYVRITPAMVTAATNVVYLVVQANFATGTANSFGFIGARRRS